MPELAGLKARIYARGELRAADLVRLLRAAANRPREDFPMRRKARSGAKITR